MRVGQIVAKSLNNSELLEQRIRASRERIQEFVNAEMTLLMADLVVICESAMRPVESEQMQQTCDDSTKIASLGLPTRATGCLLRAGIHTVGELKVTSKNELRKIENLGRKSLSEIVTAARLCGIELAESSWAAER